MEADTYAKGYASKSTLQHAAGEILIHRILQHYDQSRFKCIGDIGCASGGVTASIYDQLKPNTMFAYDISPEMIALAKVSNQRDGLSYEVGTAEGLMVEDRFDLITSNIAFHWFKDQEKAIKNMYSSLRDGGVCAVTSSATSAWCPQFLSAVSRITNAPELAPTYKLYSSPFTMHEGKESYMTLFQEGGFDVKFCAFFDQNVSVDVGRAMHIFESGALKAFLCADYFSKEKTKDYDSLFRTYLHRDLLQQSRNGKIVVEYKRVMMLCQKIK